MNSPQIVISYSGKILRAEELENIQDPRIGNTRSFPVLHLDPQPYKLLDLLEVSESQREGSISDPRYKLMKINDCDTYVPVYDQNIFDIHDHH